VLRPWTSSRYDTKHTHFNVDLSQVILMHCISTHFSLSDTVELPISAQTFLKRDDQIIAMLPETFSRL
jgi:hypothetical protein